VKTKTKNFGKITPALAGADAAMAILAHSALRIILALAVLLIVFWLGIMVGSHHSFSRRGFNGRTPMRQSTPMTRAYPVGTPGAMRPTGLMSGQATTTPATSTQK
jgi:predicted anti-sigma-YlaC factor YlaD